MLKITTPDKSTGEQRTAAEDNHAKIVVNHNADEMALNTAHKSDSENPHGVTKAQVGLGNVDNTADTEKPISAAQQAAFNGKLDIASVVDSLDSNLRTAPLSANQGMVLKGLTDSINNLLLSDESNLDTIQEIVDFIEINKETLDTLSIAGIAGLQAALDALTNASSTAQDTADDAETAAEAAQATADAAMPKSGGTFTGPILGDVSARLFVPISNNAITEDTLLSSLVPNTKVMISTVASPVTITVDDLANTNWQIGWGIAFRWRIGPNDITFVSSGSTTVLSANDYFKIADKYGIVTIHKELNNTFYLTGGTKA